MPHPIHQKFSNLCRKVESVSQANPAPRVKNGAKRPSRLTKWKKRNLKWKSDIHELLRTEPQYARISAECQFSGR